MIARMQKVTLFISAPYRDEALRKLRRLGVVHIQHLQSPVSEDISRLESELNVTARCLALIESNAPAVTEKKSGIAQSAKIVDEILALSSEKQQISAVIEEKKSLLNWFERWGKVSTADLEILKAKGIFIRLYNAERSMLKGLPEEAVIQVLSENKNELQLALVSESEDERLDLKEEFVPQQDYPAVVKDIEKMTGRVAEIDTRIATLSQSVGEIVAYQADLKKRLEFAAVKSGMQESGEIIYLQGYCPDEQAARLIKTSEKEGWGILSEEPEETDNPPTLLYMSRWTRIIKPVFEFLGTVPGYREYDISKYFLAFFSIFVAMIIGDAGYGMIFLLVSILVNLKTAKNGQPLPLAVKLFYVLSICTIAWGTITGNWFGAYQIGALPFFKALTIPQLATFPKEVFPGLEVDPQQKVMFICFVIAITQLGLANIMNFLKNFPQLKSIANLGWFTLMVGLFLVVLQLVLGMTMPAFTVPLIGAGLLAIILFMSQEKGVSFFKGAARGLGGAFTTFLNAISSFSNIISYIRLFAVGMASVAIASSFNQIAAPMLKGFALPAGIIVLLIGHGLNIVMGVLSVIVHGIRLNVLEFSGQLGMEWTGYEYKPFQEKMQDITEGEIQ